MTEHEASVNSITYNGVPSYRAHCMCGWSALFGGSELSAAKAAMSNHLQFVHSKEGQEYYAPRNGWGCALLPLAVGVVPLALALWAFSTNNAGIGIVLLLVTAVPVGLGLLGLSSVGKSQAQLDKTASDAKKRNQDSVKERYSAPPAGSADRHPGMMFVRLTEGRWKGMRADTEQPVMCGVCGYEWLVPRLHFDQYRDAIGPGASLRRVNQPQLQAMHAAALDRLKCPACGSTDPGVWVHK